MTDRKYNMTASTNACTWQSDTMAVLDAMMHALTFLSIAPASGPTTAFLHGVTHGVPPQARANACAHKKKNIRKVVIVN